jgi:Uma2 family endonuclease
VATSTTRLMTFAEFQEIPDPPGGYYELHHGELIQVAFPDLPHGEIQHRLLLLLLAAAADSGVVRIETPYRPVPEHEAWRADVVYVAKARWNPKDQCFFGAPDLVIEVLSPSNKAEELIEKRNLCLENGSREFWVVNGKRRHVEVSTPDGRTVTYKSSQEIPLIFGGALTVDSIFV